MSRPTRATRSTRAALVLLVGTLLGALVGALPAGAGAPAGGDGAEVTITDIEATGSDLRFIVTSSGLPEGTDLSEATVDVAFQPAGEDAVPLDSEAVAVADSVVVPRQTAILAVDVSGSLGPSGLEDVRDAVDVFLDTVPPEVEVGLVTFEAPPERRVEPPRTVRRSGTPWPGWTSRRRPPCTTRSSTRRRCSPRTGPDGSFCSRTARTRAPGTARAARPLRTRRWPPSRSRAPS